MDLKVSKQNSNDSKRIRSFRNQIRTIRKGFEAFEWKFEQFERDSKVLKPNSNHSKGDLKSKKPNSKLSKGIRRIQLQI